MQKTARNLICRLLEWQVVRLRRRYDFAVIAVAGSVGKTSTKLALVATLGATKRVRSQQGNYNDRVTVPLVVFGQQLPSLRNPLAWFALFVRNERSLRRPFAYDVVVVELGTDGPGQLKDFAYLQPDITVVTAIAAEHMEYFGTIDAVAMEELSVQRFSKQLLVNAHDTDKKYLQGVACHTYGTGGADFVVDGTTDGSLTKQHITISGKLNMTATIPMLGTQGRIIACAAIAAAHMLGLDAPEIQKGVAAIRPFAGRMQQLKGIQETVLLDDTYNASPLAVRAALDVLYSANAPQRIALIGNMNELGADSASMHTDIGAYCDPDKLDLVVVLGAHAEAYTAPAAAGKGCTVAVARSPYEAGKIIAERVRPGAVILAKGSQNGVFAEEALKQLLADPADARLLVRQSAYWLAVKAKQFAQ